MKIGFVGPGNIGTHMVKRLLQAGHAVTVYARGQGLEECKAAGTGTSDDYGTLAAESDFLILCVYRDAQVREILFDHGALAAMKPGAILVNHTTGSPDLIKEVAARAKTGQKILDATFSGGPLDVTAGRLKLMIGGDADVIEQARPVLEAYSDRIFPVGAIGSGQAIKLLNNLLFGAHMMNAVELLRMAEKQGFDTRRVAEVISECSGSSLAMGLFRDATPDGLMAHTRPYMEKDVATALAVAKGEGLDVSIFAATGDYFAPNKSARATE
jgi:3-hydroxyisobutyrate dehydrogenase-like beta-hydroxyacid dehydrogenase